MSRALLLLFLFFAASALAQLSPGPLQTYDFQDDDISLVLRTMARQGNFEIIIASEIPGTVTMRADNKTPREVFDMIVAAKKLVVNERDGLLYIRPRTSALTPLQITALALVLTAAALFVWFDFLCGARTLSPR